MKDHTTSLFREKDDSILVNQDLSKELLADLRNQREHNTSPKTEQFSDGSNFITEGDWFDLKMTYKPATYTGMVKDSKINQFISIQKWEGIVESISEDSASFKATVVDLSSGSEKKGLVEFDKDEVNPGDWDLVRLGSIFYWNIGYQYNKGVRSKSSLIRFSRLPNWSTKFKEALRKKAQDRFAKLNSINPSK